MSLTKSLSIFAALLFGLYFVFTRVMGTGAPDETPRGLTIASAMFVAQPKLERQFEQADRFNYRNLRLVKSGADDVVCGEVLPLGTPPLGIGWSRFVLHVQGSHGYFGGDAGGFEFWHRGQLTPITTDDFTAVWARTCQ